MFKKIVAVFLIITLTVASLSSIAYAATEPYNEFYNGFEEMSIDSADLYCLLSCLQVTANGYTELAKKFDFTPFDEESTIHIFVLLPLFISKAIYSGNIMISAVALTI